MLGIKILSSREYKKLQNRISAANEWEENRKHQVASLSSDNRMLRKKLNESITEIQRLNLRLGQPSICAFPGLHILKSQPYPCDQCRLESSDCKKLHFANATICVCDPTIAHSLTHPKSQDQL